MSRLNTRNGEFVDILLFSLGNEQICHFTKLAFSFRLFDFCQKRAFKLSLFLANKLNKRITSPSFVIYLAGFFQIRHVLFQYLQYKDTDHFLLYNLGIPL